MREELNIEITENGYFIVKYSYYEKTISPSTGDLILVVLDWAKKAERNRGKK